MLDKVTMKLKLTILVFVLNNFPRTSFQKRKRMCALYYLKSHKTFFFLVPEAEYPKILSIHSMLVTLIQ